MKSEFAKELNLLLGNFYTYINAQSKLKGSDTKRELMKLAGECEKVASKYGFDLALEDKNSLCAHNIVMCHYVRANRSKSEAKFNAKMIVTEYFREFK